MWKDTIVEEVRKTREKILIDANYDMSVILTEIKEMEIKDKDRVVSLVDKEQVRKLFLNKFVEV